MVLERIKSILGKQPKSSESSEGPIPPKAYSEPIKLVSKYKIPSFRVDNLTGLLFTHPRIINDFENGRLSISEYCPVEMPELFRKILEKYPLPPDESMHEVLTSPLPAADNWDVLSEVLGSWAKVFDEWFFLGSLSPTLEVELVEDPLVNWRGVHHGYETGAAYQKSKVLINTSDGSTFTSCISHNQTLIGTLLHELLHAFISKHRCNKFCCTRTNPCSYVNAAIGGDGNITGHGPAFSDSLFLLNAAPALESAVKWKWVVDPNNDFASIPTSMFYDRWQPSVEQLHLYNLDSRVWSDPEVWVPMLEAKYGPYNSPQRFHDTLKRAGCN